MSPYRKSETRCNLISCAPELISIVDISIYVLCVLPNLYLKGKGRISPELLPDPRKPGQRVPLTRGHVLSTLLDPQCPPLLPSAAAGAERRSLARRYVWFLCAVSLLSLFCATTKWLRHSRGGQPGEARVHLRSFGAPVAGVDTDGEPRRRVAVCFFGLTRSLRWTLPSLQRRLLGALEEAGMEVDVFVHTFSLEEVRGYGPQATLQQTSRIPRASMVHSLTLQKEEQTGGTTRRKYRLTDRLGVRVAVGLIDWSTFCVFGMMCSIRLPLERANDVRQPARCGGFL